MLCYDSRDVEQKAYFRATQDLRIAWSKAARNRICIELFGLAPEELECCTSDYHYCWCKVSLLRLVGSSTGAKYVLWMDSDACPALDLAAQRDANRKSADCVGGAETRDSVKVLGRRR